MKKQISGKFVQSLLLLLTLVLAGVISQAGAVFAQGVAQGYASDDTSLRPGMVVQLSDASSADEPKVERATNSPTAKIIGLATSPNDSFVLSGSGQQQVYVQTSGEALAYASDLGGEIKKGDLLTLSSLKGVLMRTESGGGSIIFGTALEDFPTSSAEKYSIDGGKTDTKESLVTRITINLDSRSFTQGVNQSDSPLAKISRAIVGKNVGEVRVLIALIIFMIVLIAEAGIVYGSVSSAMTALGRNPLASNVIKKELIQVFIIAVIILSVGLAAIYGVLWV